MREDVIRTVEAYLNALGTKDFAAAPLHSDVEWQGPPGTWIKGATMLRTVLSGLFPAITGIEIVRHIVEGEWCATMFNVNTTSATIRIFDCFHVVGGQIMSIQNYSQPTLRGLTRRKGTT
jgi:limonene-1,2-epoxide hydrolase